MNARRTILALSILAAVTTTAIAQVTVRSRIVEVTVYADRALVTRRADTDIPAGETTLVFTGLPAATDPASLMVSGKGAFTLRDVRLTIRQLTRDLSAEQKSLEDEKRGYEDSLAAENDRIREAEAERLFLTEMMKRVTSSAGDSEAPPMDTAPWAKMLDFHRSRSGAVNEALRLSRKAAQGLQAEIDRVNRELRALGSGARMSVLEAEVVVEAKAAGKARVDASYIVEGPSWRPDYVLRADSEGDKLSLHYRAMVRQNTGESWTDAALRLSTARPQAGGSLPELSPWRIDVYKPAPVYKESAKQSRAMAAPAPAALGSAADQAYELAEEAPEMEYASSTADTGATAVAFSIPGATTVTSDNRDRTVTIAVLELPVDYSYAAVPKLSPYAYFRAEAKNDSDFPLLAGATHVYVDSGYVADASMGAVPPGGAFSADLGVDESVAVERKLKRKYDETSGVVSKKQKTTWEYEILVKNGKRSPIVIAVSDQLPISSNEQLVVKALAPAWLKDTDALKKTAYDAYEWTLRLEPGNETVLSLSFSVEYPKGTPIVGLE